jgi:hypothetical protein
MMVERTSIAQSGHEPEGMVRPRDCARRRMEKRNFASRATVPFPWCSVISLIKTQLQTSTLSLLRMLLRSVSPIGQKGLLPFSYRRLCEQPGFCRRYRVWPYSLRHGTLFLRTRNEGFHTTLWRTEQSRHGCLKNS